MILPDHAIRYLGPDATGHEEDAYERGYKAGAEDEETLRAAIQSAREELEAGNVEAALAALVFPS